MACWKMDDRNRLVFLLTPPFSSGIFQPCLMTPEGIPISSVKSVKFSPNPTSCGNERASGPENDPLSVEKLIIPGLPGSIILEKPSGKHEQKTTEHRNFYREHWLFLWPFSIAMWNYQRAEGIFSPDASWRSIAYTKVRLFAGSLATIPSDVINGG